MWSSIDEIDLDNMPGESDRVEYKSGDVDVGKLEGKIQAAASGMWNAGGGFFFAGIGNDGSIDKGVPRKCGRQPIEEWAERALSLVTPHAKFQAEPLAHPSLPDDRCVLAIQFFESQWPPHQAPDKKYYLRIGRHTLPAPHYVVESLHARRGATRPRVVHHFRRKPNLPDVVQLVVETATEVPAFDAEIRLSRVPDIWKGLEFKPVQLPVLSRTSPFYLDVTLYGGAKQRLGEEEIELIVGYRDGLGNSDEYRAILDPEESLVPWGLGNDAPELAKLNKTIEKLEAVLARSQKDLGKIASYLARIAERDVEKQEQ